MDEKINIELLSKKYLVYPSNALVEELKQIPGINYQIISDKVEIPKDTRPDFKRFAKA